jgi:hypothetical protein
MVLYFHEGPSDLILKNQTSIVAPNINGTQNLVLGSVLTKDSSIPVLKIRLPGSG